MWCIGLLVMRCFAAEPAPAGDTYCSIAKPIYWSRSDTRATKEQVDRENRKWKARCAKGKN